MFMLQGTTEMCFSLAWLGWLFVQPLVLLRPGERWSRARCAAPHSDHSEDSDDSGQPRAGTNPASGWACSRIPKPETSHGPAIFTLAVSAPGSGHTKTFICQIIIGGRSLSNR